MTRILSSAFSQNAKNQTLTDTVKELEFAIRLDLNVALTGQCLVNIVRRILAFHGVGRVSDAGHDQQRCCDQPFSLFGTRGARSIGDLLVRARCPVELLIRVAVRHD